MAINALKKITVKDVMKGKPQKEKVNIAVLNDDGSAVLDSDGKPVMRTIEVAKATDVCILYGRARDHRTGSTSFGPFVEYVGSFEARRIADNEVFQSTRIIFPPIAADLADADYTRIKRDDPAADVDFAYIIGVEPDQRGSEGYRFSCKPVKTSASVNDPLAELRSSLALNFAESLGGELAQRLGFDIGSTALNITDQSKKEDPPHDKETGEIIEGTLAPSKKDKTPA